MKSFVDSLMNSSFNLVKRVPSKLINVEDYIYDKSGLKENRIPNQKKKSQQNHQKIEIVRFEKPKKSSSECIKQKFIDSFRSMVDFNIPVLTEGDPDYEEFSNDPKIPLFAAVSNLVHQTQFEMISYAGAIVLLRKMFNGFDKKRHISINNMHRLLTVSIMLANKYIEDIPASNYNYAVASGFTNEAINVCELEFLECLEYDAFISEDEVIAVLEEWQISIKN